MKNKYLFLFPLLLTICCSCSYNKEPEKNIQTTDNIEPGQANEGEDYKLIDSSTFAYQIDDVKVTAGFTNLGPSGNQKLLVIPVDFENTTKPWNDEMLGKLNNSFFGEDSKTSWNSVSSYYYKSSYGKLNISGEVAPVFKCSQTVDQLISAYKSSSKISPDDTVINEWLLIEDYDDLRFKYDTNGDGYIDAVALIYNAEINVKNGFWAWTSWYSKSKQNIYNPVIRGHMWAGYDFINGEYSNFGKSGLDSHTFIHETGHLLGLYDYYPDSNIVDASGRLDMHSESIGDENVYTKFSLGWTNPYYVKTEKSVTLNIRTSSKYSDAILINDSWNNTPFDEYILIEYYSPTINNENDSKNQTYKGYQMYQNKGVRIYHIDSRLVQFDKNNKPVKFYTPKTKEELAKGTYLIGPRNEPSRAYLPVNSSEDIRQVQLIDAKNRYYFDHENLKDKYKGKADNNTLFYKDTEYIPSSTFFPNNGLFNNGENIGYKIKINSITTKYANITIEKNVVIG